MADFAQVDMFIRLAAVPEMDPVQDKVLFKTVAKRADGYAREDDRVIIEAAGNFVPEFDAFAADSWIDMLIMNEAGNVAYVVVSDAIAPAVRQRLEVGQTLLIRHYHAAASAPVFVSLLGCTLRYFAWGAPVAR